MKDNKLKLQETGVVTVVAAFETVSFGLTSLMINTRQQPDREYS